MQTEKEILSDKYSLVAYAHAAPFRISQNQLSISIVGGLPTPTYWPVDVDPRLFKRDINERVAEIDAAILYLNAAKQVLETGKSDVPLILEEELTIEGNVITGNSGEEQAVVKAVIDVKADATPEEEKGDKKEEKKKAAK